MPKGGSQATARGQPQRHGTGGRRVVEHERGIARGDVVDGCTAHGRRPDTHLDKIGWTPGTLVTLGRRRPGGQGREEVLDAKAGELGAPLPTRWQRPDPVERVGGEDERRAIHGEPRSDRRIDEGCLAVHHLEREVEAAHPRHRPPESRRVARAIARHDPHSGEAAAPPQASPRRKVATGPPAQTGRDRAPGPIRRPSGRR